MQKSVFDVVLEDVRACRVKKASFAGLIETEQQVKLLAQALQANTHMVELHLSQLRFSEKAVRLLFDFLKKKNRCCLLQKLDLRESDLRKSELWDVMKSNKSIKSLVFVFTQLDTTSKKMVKALKRNETLTEMMVSKCFLDGKRLAEALLLNGSVSLLYLKENGLGDEGVECLAEMLKTNHSIKSVCLEMNGIQVRGAKAIGDALKVNQSITRLHLAVNAFGPEGVQYIADGLKVNRHVQDLDIAATRLGQRGSIALCDALKVNSSLTILHMYQNHLGPEDGCAIGDALRYNTSLTYLDISSMELGSEGTRAMCEGLSVNQVLKSLFAHTAGTHVGQLLGTILVHNRGLTEVDLGWNKLEPGGDHLIGQGLKVNKKLQKLSLCAFRLEDVSKIADGINGNSVLRCLNFSCNELGADGARIISDTLLTNQSVEELSMSTTRLGVEGFHEIARILKSNKCLKCLRLAGNGVKTKGLHAIVDALKTNRTLQSLWIGNAMCSSRDYASELCDLLSNNSSLTEILLPNDHSLADVSKVIADSIAKSPSLMYVNLEESGMKEDHVNEVLQKNKNILGTKCGNKIEQNPLYAHNRFLREVRVEHAVLTLMAIRRRTSFLPKEMLLMIAKLLLKTLDDPCAWRVSNVQ